MESGDANTNLDLNGDANSSVDCGLQVAIGNSIVLCNLVSADRNGMAASRFLAAVGACVILLCFPAES